MGDPHCAHLVGLTPPRWQWNPRKGDARHRRIARLQAECWDFYKHTIRKLKPIDIAFVNGDCLDGRGEKSGSLELITVNRLEQCKMAIACIKLTGAKQVVISMGTPYHTGQLECWEDHIADKLGAQIGAHVFPEVNGLIFDMKHHIGGSSVPHGRTTAISRDHVWNLLIAERKKQPRAAITLRSHVHFHAFAGGADWLGMTLPSLQAAGTKFGALRCSGDIDFGLVHFDVNARGGYTWQAHIAELVSQRARTIKL